MSITCKEEKLFFSHIFSLIDFGFLFFFFFIEGHLEKLLADKKLEEEKRQEYESVIGQVKWFL